MINKTQIQDNLDQLEKLHQQYIGDKKGLYYSKLAILEACGWIEESMDDIVRSCAKHYLTSSHNIDYVDNTIINRTNSFAYEQHFRQMIMRVLGIINTERLENILDQHKFVPMKSSLLTLKDRRDTQAHTHIKGTTMIIDAPSVTKKHFLNVYDGLKNIESCVRKLKI
jgi:hypothetical protein